MKPPGENFGKERSPQVFMVQPDTYHSDPEGLVRARWEILRAFIEASGGKVVALAPSEQTQVSRELYIRDRMFLIPEKKLAVISKQEGHQALLNQAQVKLRKLGYQIRYMNEKIEGGNLLYHPDGYILQGAYSHDDRTKLGSEAARKELEEVTGIPVISVKIPNPEDYPHFNPSQHVTQERFFHLDLMANVLPDGKIFIPENYLYKDELEKEIERVTGKKPAFVELPFAHPVNFIQVGDNIITEDPRIWLDVVPDNRMEEAITASGCKARHIFSIAADWDGDASRLDTHFRDKVFESLASHGRGDLCSQDALLELYDKSMFKLFEINQGNARCLTLPISPASPAAGAEMVLH